MQISSAVPGRRAVARSGRAADRLEDAIRAHEIGGLVVAVRVKWAALAAIAAWLMFDFVRRDDVAAMLYYDAVLATMALLALAQLRMARTGRCGAVAQVGFVIADMAVLGFALSGFNPLESDEINPGMFLRWGLIIYFFVFVALSALGHVPVVVFASGVAAALAVVGVFLNAVSYPGNYWIPWHEGMANYEDYLGHYFSPAFVPFEQVPQSVVILLIVAGVLAVAVWRARRLLRSQVAAEHARTNLARYVPPGLAERLAETDEPFGPVNRQDVAVLFTDIFGFTALAEEEPPEMVVALLRDYHRRVAGAVFDHDGTLDKYIGDGVMATFGAVRRGAHDATSALACARAILDAVGAWNAARRAEGAREIRVGVGLHYGPAVLGDVGDAQRLEFAVIGDTVNLASRLERLTRDLDARLVVSQALIDAARAEGAEPGLLAGLDDAGLQDIRGRAGAVRAWVLR